MNPTPTFKGTLWCNIVWYLGFHSTCMRESAHSESHFQSPPVGFKMKETLYRISTWLTTSSCFFFIMDLPVYNLNRIFAPILDPSLFLGVLRGPKLIARAVCCKIFIWTKFNYTRQKEGPRKTRFLFLGSWIMNFS